MIQAAATALVALYALGYVAGGLLVDPATSRSSLSWTIIRVFSGLLLTTLAFLCSLVLGAPWFAGPAVVVAAALVHRRWSALALFRPAFRWSADAAVAAAIGAVALSPVVVSAIRMVPGDAPPMFFNVDVPHALEQVHTLTRTSRYPPESLSNLGGRRSYHFATMGMAALISRVSGLRAHHSLFGIVLPLLAVGVLASALAAARGLAPELRVSLAAPLLVIATPSFWYSFSSVIGPLLWEAMATLDFDRMHDVFRQYQIWGTVAIAPQNVGAHAVVLATLAATAGAHWRLAVFLVGTAIMVKVPTGLALAAGFVAAQSYRAVAARSLKPLLPAVLAAAAFAATYGAFWRLSEIPPDFSVVLHPLYHVDYLVERGLVGGFAFDLAWVVLPAGLVAFAGLRDEGKRTLPLVLFAIVPFLIVNMTRTVDQRPGREDIRHDDWLQILMPVTFLLHALVIAFVGARWLRLRRAMRAVFVVLVALATAPTLYVSARYVRTLIERPQDGHEFVDNRGLAAALAAVPIEGSLIVTNDLRYPADGFRREERQMQIPALYGHQAFAVNYVYEIFGFSRERRAVQKLLQGETWNETIDDAARRYGWTHLLIRKDYRHPARIPLPLIVENERYAVYRF